MDFGAVWMPKKPLQVEDPERLYKVSVSSLMIGTSGQKLMDGIATDWSKTKWPSGNPMFNVTLITADGNEKMKKKVGNTLHLAHTWIPDNVDFRGDQVATLMKNFDKYASDLIFERNQTEHDKITVQGKYDLAFNLFFPFDHLYMSAVYKTAQLKWATYLPEPMLTPGLFQPWTGMS